MKVNLGIMDELLSQFKKQKTENELKIMLKVCHI